MRLRMPHSLRSNTSLQPRKGRAGRPEQNVESFAMRERVHAANKIMIGHDYTQCLCNKRPLLFNFWGKRCCICPARKKIRLPIAGGTAADTWPALAEADCGPEPPLLLRERFLPDIECYNSEMLTCAQKNNLEQLSP